MSPQDPTPPVPDWARAAGAPTPEECASREAQGPSDAQLDAWLQGRDPASGDFADGVRELWESDRPPAERLAWMLAVARRHPDNEWLSAVWIRLRFHEPDAVPPALPDPALAGQLYRFYAEALTGTDRLLAETVETSLYVDVFEDPDLGMAAWTWYTLREDLPPALWDVLLRNSGPVPWPLKFPFLVRRSEDKAHHLGVYLAIRHALFDANGSVDEEGAALLFTGLKLEPHAHRIEEPDGFPSLEAVRQRLEGLF
jgi:hypothetical protein